MPCSPVVGITGTTRGEIPKPDDAPRALSPEESARRFKVPAGFRVELIASEPLLHEPSGVCWDERGQLFVSRAARLQPGRAVRHRGAEQERAARPRGAAGSRRTTGTRRRRRPRRTAPSSSCATPTATVASIARRSGPIGCRPVWGSARHGEESSPPVRPRSCSSPTATGTAGRRFARCCSRGSPRGRSSAASIVHSGGRIDWIYIGRGSGGGTIRGKYLKQPGAASPHRFPDQAGRDRDRAGRWRHAHDGFHVHRVGRPFRHLDADTGHLRRPAGVAVPGPQSGRGRAGTRAGRHGRPAGLSDERVRIPGAPDGRTIRVSRSTTGIATASRNPPRTATSRRRVRRWCTRTSRCPACGGTSWPASRRRTSSIARSSNVKAPG